MKMKELNLSSVCPLSHGGVPIAIGMKVQSPPAGQAGKEADGVEFIILLPLKDES
jgi:hypothetical protein